MIATFLSAHRSRIVETLSQRIRQTTPAYMHMPLPELQDRVAQGVAAFIEALSQDDLTPLDRFIAATVASRQVDTFPLAGLHAAFTAFGELLLPLLRECHGDNLNRVVTDLHRLHVLKDAILTRLVACYETRAREVFRAQQEHLEQQLMQTGEAFQTLYEFNENVIQSMTSGLLVVDQASHRILKVNRAMEGLGGFGAADVIGKTVEEVFADYHGLPLSDFADEVARQGTITRRDHRLSRSKKGEFYRSIKGQTFYNHRGEAKGVIVMVDDISESELLRQSFSRYLSPQVLDQVLAANYQASLQQSRCELTVLFADLRHFTRFAEGHPPEEVVEVLNQYLDVMVEVIFAHQGTLDKFLGDGLLALFGAPLPQPDHQRRAVQTALAMQRALDDVNRQRRQRGAVTLEMGIGINSGQAIAGTIGSEKRMEYTVIGDMVNVAQRLQSHARGGEILISAATFPAVASLITVYETIETDVKGRRQSVRAYRVGPPTWVADGQALKSAEGAIFHCNHR